jgi:acetylornithine deacetylase
MFRVVTSTSDLKRLIENTVAGRADVQYTFQCEPVFTEELPGMDTAVVAFTTDIPMLSNWGKPLLFGPGSILDAHTAGERISKFELAHAVGAYAGMVKRLIDRSA